MGVIKIDIRYANGERESALIEGERALIGSASFCDVRLPMDQAAYEHVLIEVHGGTLRAETKVDSPAATINGMPFAASALAPDAVLGIGNVRLFVSLVADAVDGPKVKAKQKDEANPVVRIAGLAVFGALLYFVLVDPQTSIGAPPVGSIKLFVDTPKVACPQTQPQAALALAQEKLSQAEGKRERLPFDVRQGISAVPLYDQAIACFNVANRPEDVKDTETARNSLKRSMADDFRARRLRLEHMLAVQDYELAKRDVLVLRDMTEDRHGDYVDWLASVHKRLFPKKVE